ncbi:MAG: flagellar hook assembly protein FlgD [Alphaproteobacteria bacterium]|nr:flagellar hook assembly protein FlgD [Alphaproteobacteria bacterium]
MLSGNITSAAAGTASQASKSEAKLKEDLNKFLTLLVTQLKHQDPLDPMDSTEFTSQLVQFASVEQQIHQNANLEKLIGLQQGNQISTLVSYIGMRVEAEGQKVPLEYGAAKFSYTLDGNMSKTTINIVNSKGLTIATTEGELSVGRHDFTWDGRDKNGLMQPDGDYTVVVTAQNRDGKLAPVAQTIFGYVRGASADGGKVLLHMGNKIEVPIDGIKSVSQ